MARRPGRRRGAGAAHGDRRRRPGHRHQSGRHVSPSTHRAAITPRSPARRSRVPTSCSIPGTAATRAAPSARPGWLEKDVNFAVTQEVQQLLEAQGRDRRPHPDRRLQHHDQDARRDRRRPAAAGVPVDSPQRRTGRTVGRPRQRDLLPDRQRRLEAARRPHLGGDHRRIHAVSRRVGGGHRPRRQVPARLERRRLLRDPPQRRRVSRRCCRRPHSSAIRRRSSCWPILRSSTSRRRPSRAGSCATSPLTTPAAAS